MEHWRSLLIWIESLGSVDATVLAAVGVLVALLARRAHAIAFRYAFWLALVMTIGVATKLAYYGWGIRFGMGAYHGMSGHVLRSFAVYPALAYAISTGWSDALRIAGVLLGAIVALAVTAVIVGLRVHTPAEAISGGIVGWLVSVWLIRHDWLAPLSHWILWPLALVCVLACGLAAWKPYLGYDFESRVALLARQMRHVIGSPPCRVRNGLVECHHRQYRNNGN